MATHLQLTSLGLTKYLNLEVSTFIEGCVTKKGLSLTIQRHIFAISMQLEEKTDFCRISTPKSGIFLVNLEAHGLYL
jgi:hypothetical protein